jgi:hypothetical protein
VRFCDSFSSAWYLCEWHQQQCYTERESESGEDSFRNLEKLLERLVSLLFWKNGRIEISTEEVIDDQEEKVEEQVLR